MTRLYAELDATTSTHAKLAALERYFGAAAPADAAWAVFFLAGGRPRQPVPAAVLRDVAIDAAGLPRWLFDECYHAVGEFGKRLAVGANVQRKLEKLVADQTKTAGGGE